MARAKATTGKRNIGPFTVYRGWTDEERVLDQLSLTRDMLTDDDESYLRLTVDAANRAIAYWRPDLEVPHFQDTRGPFSSHFHWEYLGGANDDYREDWMIVLGATMLAMSWFQRRGSDIAAFAEFGGPPPAIGRDIEQLLRINRAARPVIA